MKKFHCEKYGPYISPDQMIPALQDEDFVLTESCAIMRYICAKKGLFKFYIFSLF